MITNTPESHVTIVYKNYRDEEGARKILPISIAFKTTHWHPQEQWILDAYDVDKEAHRSFAMADIKSWTKKE